MPNAALDTLKRKLRDAGIRIATRDQVKVRNGSLLLFGLTSSDGKPLPSLIVEDMGGDGYRLFIERPGLSIDADVQAIIRAGLDQL